MTDEDEAVPFRMTKEVCTICMKQEHKYKCPRCMALSCSLGCSKEHKQATGCSGQKDHVSSLKLKMNDFSLVALRKDLKFMDSAISLSNTCKKKASTNEDQGGTAVSKIPKKTKNLRYFLKKKRNITFKHSPSALFTRSSLNTTYFDTTLP